MRAIAIICGTALALAVGAAAAAEPLTVRAGWVVAPATMTPILFANKAINGDPISLADFKGKVVVLKFWASW